MTFYTAEQLRRPRRLIGLMSGTSVDGIDAAAVEIAGTGDDIAPRLAAYVEVAMDPALRAAVHDAFNGRAGAASLTALHVALGLAFAEAAVEARAAAGWKRGEVDAIGSHGQTIWHQPEPVAVGGAFVTGTIQLGDPATIAEATRAPVVSDFRGRDMAAGGQGAPLVPMVDWLLYRRPDRNRVLLNVGGIANATWLPAGAALDDVVAFDTGPGNMVMDAAASTLTAGRQRYDPDGAMAARGRVSAEALSALMAHPFLALSPPKSTGREVFGASYTADLLRRLQGQGLDADDILATLAAFTARSVGDALMAYLPGRADELVVTGGGARNPTLLRLLAESCSGVPVHTMEDLDWNGDAKEAVAFAVLADRTMQGLPGNVPSATGASRPVTLGSVTPAL